MQLSGEELHSVSERDSTGGAGSGGSDAASPLTARSLRLERVVQALAHSQEELRRYTLLAFNSDSTLQFYYIIPLNLCIFLYYLYIQNTNINHIFYRSHISKIYEFKVLFTTRIL